VQLAEQEKSRFVAALVHCCAVEWRKLWQWFIVSYDSDNKQKYHKSHHMK